MLASCDRRIASSCFALLAFAACAVFPDHAVLPVHGGAGGAAPVTGDAGNSDGELGGGVGAVPSAAGGAPGASSAVVAGAPTEQGGTTGGGAAPSVGGASLGGVGGGAVSCPNPREVVVPLTVDTWIEAAKPKTGHESATSLSVQGTPDERRALLQLVLPVPLAGAELRSAELRLELVANTDATGRARVLAARPVLQNVGSSTTWLNYSNGTAHQWDQGGGDLGAELARADVPAATTGGELSFELGPFVRESFASKPVTLALALLEVGDAPPAPSALELGSLEGAATKAPRLLLEYCQP